MSYLEKEFKTAFMRDRTILKTIAHTKLVTSNPSTNALTIMIKSPLIIREKSPNVKKLIGNVRIVIIGLINVLITPNTTATITAVIKLSIRTPD